MSDRTLCRGRLNTLCCCLLMLLNCYGATIHRIYCKEICSYCYSPCQPIRIPRSALWNERNLRHFDLGRWCATASCGKWEPSPTQNRPTTCKRFGRSCCLSNQSRCFRLHWKKYRPVLLNFIVERECDTNSMGEKRTSGNDALLILPFCQKKKLLVLRFWLSGLPDLWSAEATYLSDFK